MRELLQSALDVLGTLELEEVVEQLLSTFLTTTTAQGAALWIADEQGELVLRGERGVVGRDALAIPLLGAGEAVGLVHLQPPVGSPFGPADRAAAATLAQVAAIALRNARRFRALEEVALRDPASGTYRLPYLANHASKELDKARRYARKVSVVVLSVDNLDALRATAGAESAEAATHALVGAVSRVVRGADVLASASAGEYRVLLPETDRFGALMFQRRAADEIRRDPALRRLAERSPVLVSAGAATFPGDGDDLEALLQTCLQRREEDRSSILRRLRSGLDAMTFWDLGEALLREPVPDDGSSARLPDAGELLDLIRREIVRELGRDVRSPGVAYLGEPEDAALASLASALPDLGSAARAGDTCARIYWLRPRGGEEPQRGAPLVHPLVTSVAVEADARIRDRRFVLFLSEYGAYAAVQGAGGELFHSSDAPLVDLLIAKLQEHYQLRPGEAT